MSCKSLKRTIVTRLLIPVFFFLLLETTLSYWMTLHYVDKTYDRWLLNSAHALEQEIKVNQQHISIELSTNAQEIFSWDDVDKTYFKIIAERQGKIAGDSALPEAPPNKLDAPYPQFFNAQINNIPVRVVAIRVKNQSLPEKVIIYVAETFNKRHDMMLDILLADLIPQLIFALFISLYLFKNIKIILSPFHKLATQIAQRSPQDLSPLTDKHVFSEVKTLTDTINQLLLRLTTAIAAQQRFIANAAHQLRTPLAGLKLQAQVAQRENDIVTIQTALGKMQNSADRISHLISQLLLLARSEPIKGSHPLKPLDLHHLVRDTCMEWVPKALQKQMDLSLNSEGHPIRIKGDAILLRELLSNLIDNAICYGHDKGHIAVTLQPGKHPCLTVENDGHGISSAEQERIFERFYRIQGSPGNGCGLGLSIVKEIAELHRAKIQAENRKSPPGFIVHITFLQAK